MQEKQSMEILAGDVGLVHGTDCFRYQGSIYTPLQVVDSAKTKIFVKEGHVAAMNLKSRTVRGIPVNAKVQLCQVEFEVSKWEINGTTISPDRAREELGPEWREIQ